MTRPDDIVAYTYAADIYCGPCVIEVMIASGDPGAAPAARRMAVEDALDLIADANVIDRGDESSFDTDYFPKVVFRDQLEDDDRCGRCGKELD